MSKLSYRTLEFSVSGWLDQVQIGYVQNDGRLDEDQEGPGFKLFGYNNEEVLVEFVCWPSEGESTKRSTGWIWMDQAGTVELFSVFLPLPRESFDWLWATLARCQDCLSKIEVAVSYAPENLANDPRKQEMLIMGASFTLCVGDYFKVR